MSTTATLLLKANDTLPELRVQLSDAAGLYVIPADATVFVNIKGNGLVHSIACAIENRAQGIVSYDRSGAENAKPGFYSFEFEVRIPPSARRTFPSDGYLPVTIGADLG
jgi:hypothetical protein